LIYRDNNLNIYNIKNRLDAASSTFWWWKVWNDGTVKIINMKDDDRFPYIIATVYDGNNREVGGELNMEQTINNASFIAYAHQDIRILLSYIRMLESYVENCKCHYEKKI